MAIAITRTEHDAAGLHRVASCSTDANTARQMLALALVMEGRSRAEAAQSCGGSGSAICRCGRTPRPRIPQPSKRIKNVTALVAAAIAAAIPGHAHGKPIEPWWPDEARVGQQGTLADTWADPGGRTRAAGRPPLGDCRYR